MGGDNGAQQLDTAKDHVKHKVDDHHRHGPKPKEGGAPKLSGDEAVVQHFLDDAKKEVATLSKDKLDKVLAPDAVIASSCQRILAGFHNAEKAIGNVDDPHKYLEQLDRIIADLFRIGRRHHVLMREAGLESVFDAEDSFRKAAGQEFRHRAEAYYDDEVGSAKGTKTSDAGTTAGELKSAKKADAKLDTREQVLAYVKNIANDINDAVLRGYADAESIIKEPNQARKPELLEELAKMAANMAIGYFNGILTGIVTKAFNKAWGSITAPAQLDLKNGLEGGKGPEFSHLGNPNFGHLGPSAAGNLSGEQGGEHAGGEAAGEKPLFAEVLLETFKDGAKEGAVIVKNQIDEKLGPEEKKPEGKDTKQSGKSIYLHTARQMTGTRLSTTRTNFAAQEGEFKRMPVDRLKAIAEAFNGTVFDEIQNGWRDAVVLNWVNFGKEALQNGEDVRDPDKKPRVNSKLDPTYGVVDIWLRVDGTHFQFEKAETPFLGDAVLANIQNMPGGLGDLALNRRVMVMGAGAGASFNVDPNGKITTDPSTLSTDAKVFYANLRPNKGPGGNLSDGEVYAGMYALLAQLNKIPASRIADNGYY